MKTLKKRRSVNSKTLRNKSNIHNITPKLITKSFLNDKKIKIKKIQEIQKIIKTPVKILNCSPVKDQSDFTCYGENDLEIIKNMWNIRNPNNKVYGKNKKKIWIDLMNKMKNVCNNEMCWLKQQFIDHNISTKLMNNNFAPLSPKSWTQNPNTWLSNYDLDDVMKQYEQKYKDFSFIGPSPIDFDKSNNNKCVWNDLCMFDLNTYIDRGKTKIGIIFNTDPHDKSGSHWISLFINVDEGYIYFFDSNGNKIPDEIDVLVKRIINQSKLLGKKLKFSQNYPKIHQYGNTECGMYSLYFIINLLDGTVKPSFFNKKKIDDNDVQIFRKIFFNN